MSLEAIERRRIGLQRRYCASNIGLPQGENSGSRRFGVVSTSSRSCVHVRVVMVACAELGLRGGVGEGRD
jgi:hypothetical protein